MKVKEKKERKEVKFEIPTKKTKNKEWLINFSKKKKKSKMAVNKEGRNQAKERKK